MTSVPVMRIGDRVKLKKSGLTGIIEDLHVDHVALVAFYVVQFEDGKFDTYTYNELTKEQS